MSKIDDLLEEIHDNACQDREALAKIRDKVVDGFDATDPLAKAVISDNMARLSDSLTKVNMQLLEIAKIRLKKEIASSRKSEQDDGDSDAMFDEIGDGFDGEKEEGVN